MPSTNRNDAADVDRNDLEHEISYASTLRYRAFLERELTLIPAWHPRHAFCADALGQLEDARDAR